MVLKRRAEDRKDWQKLKRPGVLYLHLSRLLKEEEAQTSVTREFEQVPGKMVLVTVMISESYCVNPKSHNILTIKYIQRRWGFPKIG